MECPGEYVHGCMGPIQAVKGSVTNFHRHVIFNATNIEAASILLENHTGMPPETIIAPGEIAANVWGVVNYMGSLFFFTKKEDGLTIAAEARKL